MLALGKKKNKTNGLHLKPALLPIPRHETVNKCTLVHDYISFWQIDGVSINKAKILP